MTLDDLLLECSKTQNAMEEASKEYVKANITRREIEAKYVVDGNTKTKAEALFIVNHKDERNNYQDKKQKFVSAELAHKKAKQVFYHVRDNKNQGDLVDSAISKLMSDNF